MAKRKKFTTRKTDADRHRDRAYAEQPGPKRDRLTLEADIVYWLGRYNEKHGYRDDRKGRPAGSKAKRDKYGPAVDWALAESRRTGETRHHVLAQGAIKACLPAIFKGARKPWESTVKVIAGKIKKALSVHN